jgi:hypothetical protein
VGKPLVRFCEGPGCNLDHGRDHVAPPGKQAANREHKLRLPVRGVPGLLETPRPLLGQFANGPFCHDACSPINCSTGKRSAQRSRYPAWKQHRKAMLLASPVHRNVRLAAPANEGTLNSRRRVL